MEIPAPPPQRPPRCEEGRNSDIGSLISRNEQTILPEWIELQKKAGILHTGRITEGELQSQSRNFLQLLRDALAKGGSDASDPAYEPARAMLEDSRARAPCRASRRPRPRPSSSRSSSRCSTRSNRDTRAVARPVARRVWTITRCSTSSACSRSRSSRRAARK